MSELINWVFREAKQPSTITITGEFTGEVSAELLEVILLALKQNTILENIKVTVK